MVESTEDSKKHRKDLSEEDRVILNEEKKKKARKRTRGPYRKSSSVGL